MTPAEAYTLAPVLLAYGKGEVVQLRWSSWEQATWYDATEYDMTHHLTQPGVEWRVKPTPREWVLGEFHQPANGQRWKVLFDTMGEASKATSQLSSGTVYTLVRVVEAPL